MIRIQVTIESATPGREDDDLVEVSRVINVTPSEAFTVVGEVAHAAAAAYINGRPKALPF